MWLRLTAKLVKHESEGAFVHLVEERTNLDWVEDFKRLLKYAAAEGMT